MESMLRVAAMFQSTHSHGVRLFDLVARPMETSFNPRTHMECDLILLALVQMVFGFNPRTHMECDCASHKFSSQDASFNPRTHMECDARSTI